MQNALPPGQTQLANAIELLLRASQNEIEKKRKKRAQPEGRGGRTRRSLGGAMNQGKINIGDF